MSPSPNRSSQSKRSSRSSPVNEPAVNMSKDIHLDAPHESERVIPEPLKETPPEPESADPTPQEGALDQPEMMESEEEAEEESSEFSESPESVERLWQHPIPPPSEARQYRAIGLVHGRYIASADQFTQGTLLTSEGKLLDAVLLGRVMSLVKKHIDLDQDHLWVVYPRTRQQEGNLHVQIMGVWEPETLRSDESEISDESSPEIKDSASVSEESKLVESGNKIEALPDVQQGYFSIRGEVVYQSQEVEKYVIVKIRQAPRKDNDKPKFFKLKLMGIAGMRAVGHFWDLHVQLQEDYLVIQESHDIGFLPTKKRKPPFQKGGPRRQPGQGYSNPGSRPPYKPKFQSDAPPPPPRREPLAKPLKRKAASEES
ncbi:hypothetical protein PCC9214_02516 [Planktothrix tepida]|uniref:Uncharacterized protein n=1 Tax=Planktothrix tepida PCC 9214 TaxID=671072 RepID=A0A1J1LKK4_9CYAN|nr:hypothetical protein [Planktothrix tepida]CAD5950393.1 hypothetical protein PCC9214_02516 [Planktothrix tepida]CUR32562.1 conserved hypothetical protein [Planktothrix tepida PCC 9214]